MKRSRAYLTQEQVASVAYGLWLCRMTGSAAQANRYARESGVAHSPARGRGTCGRAGWCGGRRGEGDVDGLIRAGAEGFGECGRGRRAARWRTRHSVVLLGAGPGRCADARSAPSPILGSCRRGYQACTYPADWPCSWWVPEAVQSAGKDLCRDCHCCFAAAPARAFAVRHGPRRGPSHRQAARAASCRRPPPAVDSRRPAPHRSPCGTPTARTAVPGGLTPSASAA
ncbi:DUF6417 family protein [Streptomyces sp. Ag82_O1-15]|uniref:DUF6417 family protein n=1 Tax=Streptomyces sp. Ag82_O1-15 TaxID=1938855 RepID=UPI00359C82F7